MNKEWSEKNKRMQSLLKKSTFSDGIKELTELRNILFNEIMSWKNKLDKSDYSKMPFINAQGYHSKTVAYSIWHIFRIEDIVVNSLILNREEILFSGGFERNMNSEIITTGNELVKNEIAEFSEKLDTDVLYKYAEAVRESTDRWLVDLGCEELDRRFGDEDKNRLKALGVVSNDENAQWLIDYWCGKDIKGLLKMPLSRHWIMHIEAADRIIKKLEK